ncbi:MarR family winged helix-turn-helix transcriptional regulator [Paracoccus marinaquae]|uniref:MarR family transcriptional regulator n=1 Tax=Paracoccus marinaquae TaxID=2841926 RepID=A0ABS6ARY3_9RHOB|nr:MarR family transcriptional regulator [Paracoccus marinaquae]MBU3032379.1 MarR family transcriptional regulator [Paracoccus marinaquae]
MSDKNSEETLKRNPDAELAFRLRDTLARGARRVRIDTGPPLAQMSVLGLLTRNQAMSTNDLAAAERMRPQSMTVIVRTLEENGLVQRRPHPTDRRQTLIEKTEKGSQLLNEILAMREDWLARVIATRLDATERAELKRGLELISRVIED